MKGIFSLWIKERIFQFSNFKGEERGVCGGDLTTGLATGGDGIIKLFLASAPAGSLTVRRKLSTSP